MFSDVYKGEGVINIFFGANLRNICHAPVGGRMKKLWPSVALATIEQGALPMQPI